MEHEKLLDESVLTTDRDDDTINVFSIASGHLCASPFVYTQTQTRIIPSTHTRRSRSGLAWSTKSFWTSLC